MRDTFRIKSKDSGKKLSQNSMNESKPISENDFSVCLRIQFGKFVYATLMIFQVTHIKQTVINSMILKVMSLQ